VELSNRQAYDGDILGFLSHPSKSLASVFDKMCVSHSMFVFESLIMHQTPPPCCISIAHECPTTRTRTIIVLTDQAVVDDILGIFSKPVISSLFRFRSPHTTLRGFHSCFILSTPLAPLSHPWPWPPKLVLLRTGEEQRTTGWAFRLLWSVYWTRAVGWKREFFRPLTKDRVDI